MAPTARLTPQSKGEAPTISSWRGLSSRNFRRNLFLWNLPSVEFVLLAIHQKHHHIVLEWLCWHFHAFRDCLIRGRWCERQWRNGRNRFVKCTGKCTGCHGLGRLFPAEESDSCSATSPGLHRIGVFSFCGLGLMLLTARKACRYVDLDQCSCFMGRFVTPGAEQSFGEFDFLVTVCKLAIVSL